MSKSGHQHRARARTVAALVAGAVATAALVAGCGDDASSSASSTGSASSSGGKTYAITWGGATPPGNPLTTQGEQFKSAVEKASGGKIKVRLTDSGTLGAPPSLVSQVKSGSIQITSLAPQLFVSYADKLNVLSLPYLFATEQDALTRLSGEPAQPLVDQMKAAGFKVLAWGSLGFNGIATKHTTVKSASDFNGLKVRVIQTKLSEQIATLLGAQPVALDASELLTGLQSGTVDADIDPIAQTVSYKTTTVANHVSELNLSFNPAMLVMNEKFFDALPANLQTAVTDAAKSATDAEVAANAKALEDAITTLKSASGDFVPYAGVDVASIQAKLSSLYPSYSQQYGASLVDGLHSGS